MKYVHLWVRNQLWILWGGLRCRHQWERGEREPSPRFEKLFNFFKLNIFCQTENIFTPLWPQIFHLEMANRPLLLNSTIPLSDLKRQTNKKEKINFEASTFYLLCFEREKDNRCSKEGKLQHNYNPNILEMYILLSYLEASSR